MSAEPERVEITAWINRTGRTVPDAVREFWPNAVGDERSRLIERVKSWLKRDRAKARKPPPPPHQPALRLVTEGEQAAASPPPEADEPAPDLSSMTASEQARWQMSELTRLHRRAGRKNDARSVVILCARLSAVRAELEEARKREGVGAAPLEPLPATVALDLVKADKQIAELAALVEQVQQQDREDRP